MNLSTQDKLDAAYGPATDYINRHEGFWGTYDICGLITTILASYEELDSTLPCQYDVFRPIGWVVLFANGDVIEDKVFPNESEARFFARTEEDRLVTQISNLQARQILVPLRVERS